MVRKFVEYSVKNGIDIIRIFDALNDVRNLEVAIDETVKQGGSRLRHHLLHHQPRAHPGEERSHGEGSPENGRKVHRIKDMAA